MDPIIITFDNNSRARVLQALSLRNGPNEELLDPDGQILTGQDFEPLSESSFGGVLQGSKIAIRKDRHSIIQYFVDKTDKEI